MKKQNKVFVAGQTPRLFVVGAKRKTGLFFLDLDTHNFDIYKTGHGIHIVAAVKHKFFYHGRRIRVSAKWDMEGNTISKKPKLLICHCPNKHVDKRMKCKLIVYVTRSE